MFRSLLACSLLILLQQAAPPLPDVQKLGPQVGDRVPDFSLTDQHGQSRTLASLVGPKGAMLVFYRSADW
jgi:hypothetical protein